MAQSVKMDMTADPNEFVEAITEFTSRRVVTREEADALSEYARKRAWWITGVAQMDVANEAHQSIVEAMRAGTPFEEWQKTAGAKIEAEWGRTDSSRLRLIFRNATTSAYNAGRLEQMDQPHIAEVRPFKMLDVTNDSRTSKICRKFIAPPVILPANHPWWLTHSPPLHHGCRDGIRSLRQSVAESKGITVEAPTNPIAEGWGLDPRLTEPPHPSERETQPDPELMLEAAVKGGKYLRETEAVAIPKSKLLPKYPVSRGFDWGEVPLVDESTGLGPKLQVGKHLKSLKAKELVSDHSVDLILNRALSEGEIEWLSRDAIRGLIIDDGLVEGAVGSYTPQLDVMRISTNLGLKPNTFSPGESWSTYWDASSNDESVRIAVGHELGHRLLMRAVESENQARGINKLSAAQREIFQRDYMHTIADAKIGGHALDAEAARLFAASDGKRMSEYAATDHDEYFAELYASYREFPEILKSRDPEGYELVEKVLDFWGIPHVK